MAARFEQAGLKVLAAKLVHLTPGQAGGFYSVHKERPFYGSLCQFMTGGPCMPIVLDGDNAIARLRDLMGATDPAKAAAGLPVMRHAARHRRAAPSAETMERNTTTPGYPAIANAGSTTAARPGAWME